MPDIHPKLPAPRPDFSAVLWRFAWPFLIFSVVLAALLGLSWFFLLPRFTQIAIGGTTRNVGGLKQYKAELTAQIAAAEDNRRQLVLAVHDPQYDALKEERRTRMPLDQVRRLITDHATAFAGKADVIHIDAFTGDSEHNTVTIRGDVRNSGVRSMTVLAGYVTSLKQQPFVAAATTPAFSRDEKPGIGPFSPFTITITLQ